VFSGFHAGWSGERSVLVAVEAAAGQTTLHRAVSRLSIFVGRAVVARFALCPKRRSETAQNMAPDQAGGPVFTAAFRQSGPNGKLPDGALQSGALSTCKPGEAGRFGNSLCRPFALG